ncbi:amidohydrolase family protein [Natronospira bacteriovora]|uniref:Amidohydrolase family protein n=1 Tax=Natronospira bacteriovora TaxID=3069753 RepID=A0ABU0W4W5_9GAMM|nr:amidohydrolase family protein [Natronospira sp. AB-CW4]MDQ2069017.1 amidohydrolase family protein [Natronospira sp. AB-CW4]
MKPPLRHYASLCLIVLLLLGACATSPPAGRVPAADHHVHLRSEIAAQALPRVQLARGYARHELSQGYQDADALIQQLDRYGIHQAAILSLGYMYAIPEVAFDNEYDKVRRENDFTAEQAARHPDRLVAFCGVSPLAEYALEEIRRCATLNVVGIKMHMANSAVDLSRDSHFQALHDATALAAELELSLLIHLRTRGHRYDSEWVQRFVDETLPLTRHVTVQLAHMGGGGGMDGPTSRATRVLAAAVDSHPKLYFDLSGAFFREKDVWDGGRTALRLRQNRQAVAEAIQRLGPERVLFGSDWDSLEYDDTLAPLNRLRSLIGDEALARIHGNRAPYFQQAGRHTPD